MKMKQPWIGLALALSAACASPSVLAEAGVLLLSAGEVVVRNAANAERAGAIGMKVESGEALVTRDGRAQLQFTDGGVISLQPNTEFKVDSYRFKDGKSANESALFKLVKGGFRAVTGLIGKREPSQYKVETSVATIGIRGTEFLALQEADESLRVHTGEGAIFLRNVAGEIDVGKGQTAYVRSAKDAPTLVVDKPALTAQEIDNRKIPELPGMTEFQPGTIVSANALGEVRRLQNGGGAFAASGTVTFRGKVHESTGAEAGGGFIDPVKFSGGLAGMYMDGDKIKGFVAQKGGEFASFAVKDVKDARSADNLLYWGRWSDTSVSLYAALNGTKDMDTVQIPASASMHYLVATAAPTTIPTSGMATYSFIGGTPSTDQAGGIGAGITSGSLTANFLWNYVNGHFNVSHGGQNYGVSALMPMDTNNRVNFSTTQVMHSGGNQISGHGSAGGYSAKVSGFFAGATSPTHAGIAYQIDRPGNAIVGVGAFRQ